VSTLEQAAQSFMTSQPKLASFFMNRLSEDRASRMGERKALSLFRDAAATVPAYKTFLAESGADASSVRTIEDFATLVPPMDKAGYIERFDIAQKCRGAELKNIYAIETSSGRQGKPTYWLRLPKPEADFLKYYEYQFVESFDMGRKSTLFIIGLALGSWAGGVKTADIVRHIARTGKYMLTVVTPGSNVAEIVDIIKMFGTRYEQVILQAYPPLVRQVLDDGAEAGIDWKNLNMLVGMGGERFSEEYRESVAETLGAQDDLMGVYSAYGASDTGVVIGGETPDAILTRKLACKDGALARDLFGSDATIPMVFQYSPIGHYVEILDDEIVFTCDGGIPLIRYNIHDRGGVIPYERGLEILSANGYDMTKELADRGYKAGAKGRMPFVYIYGRSDGTISIEGANVYPENTEAALRGIPESRLLFAYQMAVEDDAECGMRFCVHLELKDGQRPSDAELAGLERTFHDGLLAKLLELNDDYKESYQSVPKSADPLVKVHPYRHGPFECEGEKLKELFQQW
jgi:phenylacetate-CoA ligase